MERPPEPKVEIRGTPEQIHAQRMIVQEMREKYGVLSKQWRRENFKLASLHQRKHRPFEARGGRGKKRKLNVVQALQRETEEARAALDMACEESKKKAIQMAQKAAPKLMEARMREAFPTECKECGHHAKPRVGTSQYRAMVKAQDQLQDIVELCLRPDLREGEKKQVKRQLVRVDWPTEGQKT